jgi:hypothetical protein
MIGLLLANVALAFNFCARRNFEQCELFMGDELEGVYPDVQGSTRRDRANEKFTLTIAQVRGCTSSYARFA